jgi:hypothetical protein
MSSPVRAALFLAPVLGIVAVIFFSSRSGPKAAAIVRDEVPSAADDVPAVSAPRQGPVTVPVLRPPQLAASAATENPSEDSLAAAMHALEDSAPERALELARRGRALWPAGPRAPEFAATEVKSLYRLGMPSEGRGAAEAMVNKYPTSPWALEVEKQTGAHPYVDH